MSPHNFIFHLLITLQIEKYRKQAAGLHISIVDICFFLFLIDLHISCLFSFRSKINLKHSNLKSPLSKSKIISSRFTLSKMTKSTYQVLTDPIRFSVVLQFTQRSTFTHLAYTIDLPAYLPVFLSQHMSTHSFCSILTFPIVRSSLSFSTIVHMFPLQYIRLLILNFHIEIGHHFYNWSH